MSEISRCAAYTRFEAVRLLRSSGFIGPAVIIPTVMYLVFTRLGENAGDSDVAQYLMISMACFGAVGAALANGLGASEERDLGWLQQLRLTPLSPASAVLGRAILGIAVALPPIVVVLLVGAVVNHVQLTALHWAASAAGLLVGATPFSLLGICFGYVIRSTQLAQQLSMLSNLGLALVGGLWIPANNFPSALERISSWTPTSAYAGLGRGLAGVRHLDAADVGKLTLWSIVLAAVAVAAYVRAIRVD
ncbi:ABC transporter permease [Luteipulveratus mongoliensis]|uniref:ABC-2 type transporter transmembrane domain-containing protein n=1 Tax=Luteipulveratus mongoliensis TaxID=571913 RepID=A0A0K1JH89_9MICO|nr:ABC transporter permease [Luteipulveratus mongoliensis]AKU15953.1 hypothetical protein VV02_08955 [Luteipulveratus mongoliensis]